MKNRQTIVKNSEKIHYDDYGLSVLITPFNHTEVPENKSIFFIHPDTGQTAYIKNQTGIFGRIGSQVR